LGDKLSKGKAKAPKPCGSKASLGAAGRIRTADLILTNWLGTFQPLRSNAFRPFLLQKDEVSGTLCSIVSVCSFPRVGQRVGQTKQPGEYPLPAFFFLLFHTNHFFNEAALFFVVKE